MTIAEAARIMHVDRNTLYRWMNAGDGPPYHTLRENGVRANGLRSNRVIRIKRDDFDKWLESKKCLL